MPAALDDARRSGPDRFGVAALAVAGMLTAHQLGYLSDSARVVSHEHLAVLGPAALLMVSVAGWFAAARVVRLDAGGAPSWLALSGIQIILFLLMEFAEHLVAGSVSSLWSTPVILGVVLQPLVARLALELVTIGERVLLHLSSRTAMPRRFAVVFLASANEPGSSQEAGALLRSRGPPVV